eukprot:3929730-Amphidinium_carterae.1
MNRVRELKHDYSEYFDERDPKPQIWPSLHHQDCGRPLDMAHFAIPRLPSPESELCENDVSCR